MKRQHGAGRPSQTAIASAVQRALHLLWDAPPHIFYDPFAYPFAGALADAVIAGSAAALPGEVGRVARASFVVRHRWAEDELKKAVERGVRQYVILGAGLESFAWRRPDLLARLRVFEVDHPSSQQWKRERVAALRLPEPEGLNFVPVDFEHDDLAGCLNGAGFDPRAQTFVSWLGVTQYLTSEAIEETLRLVVSFGEGTAACVGYAVPEDQLHDDLDREFRSAAMNRAAAVGEPWLSFYAESDFENLVRRCGFRNVAHFGPREAMRYFAGRPDGLRPSGQARYVLADK